jgi:NodT family efflux transporter outer membrane factor (OMF) lipoprotein
MVKFPPDLMFALCVSTLVMGCATIPKMAAAPQPIAAGSLAASQALSANVAAWPGDGWWRAYGDPQLNQLVDEALSRSPDLAAAQARLDAANAKVGDARASLFPSITANGTVGTQKLSYNNGIPAEFVPKGYNSIASGVLNFTYEIDFWGKNRAAVAAATSDARASEADAAQARLILSTSVASAYGDLARLWAERDVAVRAAQSRGESLQLVGQRVSSGLDTHGELEQAKAGPPAARADVAAIDEDISLTRDQLAALTGQGPDRGLAIARPSSSILKPFGLPPTLSADLLGRRPDLTGARWRAEAAAKRIGEAKARFYPDLNLSAYIGRQSLGLGEFFASGSGIGEIAPALSLPIFDAGRLRANLAGRRADYDEAVAAYNKTLMQALQEVADAAASARALAVRLGESRDALSADEDAYHIARLRYDGGLANYQTVLLSEDTVLQARRTVADLEARAFTLDVQLIRALGGGYGSGSATPEPRQP